MKNLLFSILFSFSLFSFDRDPDKNVNPNVLPEATQSGKNTAGALVDGKVWVASKNYDSETFVELYNNHAIITIDLKSVSDNSRIFIRASIDNFELNKIYELNQNPESDFNFATYNDNTGKGYLTQPNSEYICKLKITKLNHVQDQMVCGTFEFKAVDNNGNAINITDGRFDKKFLQ